MTHDHITVDNEPLNDLWFEALLRSIDSELFFARYAFRRLKIVTVRVSTSKKLTAAESRDTDIVPARSYMTRTQTPIAGGHFILFLTHPRDELDSEQNADTSEP